MLLVNEIFHSIQGESTRVGLPTVFVRLTGCPLRCHWCDSEYAFSGGHSLTVEEVVTQVRRFNCPVVCVTGGEPLAQKDSLALLTALCDVGLDVSLETSGAMDVSAVDERVSKIMDLKAPGSGEEAANRWDNLRFLTPRDEIKCVLASPEDYDWAKKMLVEQNLTSLCTVLFSPVADSESMLPRDLAEWILRDGLPVRFQLQLHKQLWGAQRGK